MTSAGSGKTSRAGTGGGKRMRSVDTTSAGLVLVATAVRVGHRRFLGALVRGNRIKTCKCKPPHEDVTAAKACGELMLKKGELVE